MSETELKPCPFCGERAETDFIPEHHSYQVECSDSIGCTARITRDSELGAIEAWNCRAALDAPAQAVPAPGVEAVSEREFKQFLSDVLTAAGLVTHGKKCKDLGRRLGEMSMRLRTAPKTAAAPVQAHDALKEIGAIAVSAAKTNSRYIADWREDIDRIAAIAAQEGDAA